VYWIVQLPLAFLLSIKFRIGPNGAYYAILVAEVLLSLIGIYIFKKGKWKLKVV
jgi:Na+-driven multidrug efflux pump